MHNANQEHLSFIQRKVPSNTFLDTFGQLGTDNKMICSRVDLSKLSNNRVFVPHVLVKHIPTEPNNIIEAPGFCEYQLPNSVDWSSNNIIAVANGSILQTIDMAKGAHVEEFFNFTDTVTSVSWVDKKYIAVGTEKGLVQLWDYEKKKPIRALTRHKENVEALSSNRYIVSTAGKGDSKIYQQDLRVPNSLVQSLESHSTGVCKLTWNKDGTQLASGGNVFNIFHFNTGSGYDKVVNIWNINETKPRSLTQYRAPVKALAWCPWDQNCLATGSGLPGKIDIWNTQTVTCINSAAAPGGVSSIVWSTTQRRLVSSHACAASGKQLTVWKYPVLQQLANLSSPEDWYSNCETE